MTTTERYDWIDLAKGLCILSVIWLWSDRYLELQDGWFHAYARFSLPFRMPDFFFVSGLFLGRVIDRPWRRYLDSRVVHYLYFGMLWSLLYVPLSWLAQHPSSTWEAVRELIGSMTDQPKGNLWFLQMLAVYGLVTRLTKKVPSPAMVAVGIYFYLFPIESNVFALEYFGFHYVFFYVGYRFSNQILAAARWLHARVGFSTVLLLIWAVINAAIMNYFDFHLGDSLELALVLRFLGVFAVIVFSGLVWQLPWMRWLTYVGRHSLMVYLGFYVPLSAQVAIALKMGIDYRNSWFAFSGWVFCVGVALVAYWIVRKTPLAFAYERPAWARLVPAKAADPGAG